MAAHTLGVVQVWSETCVASHASALIIGINFSAVGKSGFIAMAAVWNEVVFTLDAEVFTTFYTIFSTRNTILEVPVPEESRIAARTDECFVISQGP